MNFICGAIFGLARIDLGDLIRLFASKPNNVHFSLACLLIFMLSLNDGVMLNTCFLISCVEFKLS